MRRMSLPSRERGSKPGIDIKQERLAGSLPSRERGSKRGYQLLRLIRRRSLPSRERGSKRPGVSHSPGKRRRSPRGSVDRNIQHRLQPVFRKTSLPSRERGSKQAPRPRGARQRSGRSPPGSVDRNANDGQAGEVIEGRSPRGSVDRNRRAELGLDIGQVAPLAGAWIETCVALNVTPLSASLPSRERGSKRRAPNFSPREWRVAPLAGAWIETPYPPTVDRPCWSLPSRERGSKPGIRGRYRIDRRSLPSRERGSKREADDGDRAPGGRSPRGSVDRNFEQVLRKYGHLRSLPSRERGSKRRARRVRPRLPHVAPLAGAWIETMAY